MKVLMLCLLLAISANAFAQQDTSIFSLPLRMDEVSIRAARDGWDVAAFIRTIRQDTTFYKAFKTLRVIPFAAQNDIRILDSKGQTKASLLSRTKQRITAARCRVMDVLEEKTTGNFYTRRGEYNYYTAELYAYLFFTKGTICGDNDLVAGSLGQRGSGTLEKSKQQLKQLMFNPGSKVQGVPLMGNRAALFEPEVAARYTFRLLSVDYFGEDAWLFQAIPRPEEKGRVVYDEFSTWLRKSDNAILGRNYALSFSTAVYDFDVRMKVRMTQVGGKLVPARIEYDGNWRAITKGRERARFLATFQY